MKVAWTHINIYSWDICYTYSYYMAPKVACSHKIDWQDLCLNAGMSYQPDNWQFLLGNDQWAVGPQTFLSSLGKHLMFWIVIYFVYNDMITAGRIIRISQTANP